MTDERRAELWALADAATRDGQIEVPNALTELLDALEASEAALSHWRDHVRAVEAIVGSPDPSAGVFTETLVQRCVNERDTARAELAEARGLVVAARDQMHSDWGGEPMYWPPALHDIAAYLADEVPK